MRAEATIPQSGVKSKLGIIAGSGRMPAQLIEACQAEGRDFFVLGFEDHTDPAILSHVAHRLVRLGAIGEALKILKEAAITEVVMAGRVGRPSLTALRPDFTASKLIAKIGASLFAGDDALLSAIVRFLESEGFKVIGADDVLVSLLAPQGVLTAKAPSERDSEDIAHALKVARALGALDIGQAVIVEKGYVLGVEAAEGTDGLIARTAILKQYEKGAGILLKIKKPAQEGRVDLPTIGPITIEQAYKAGLSGIAVEAGGSIILDRAEVVRRADALGLFVAGIVNA